MFKNSKKVSIPKQKSFMDSNLSQRRVEDYKLIFCKAIHSNDQMAYAQLVERYRGFINRSVKPTNL